MEKTKILRMKKFYSFLASALIAAGASAALPAKVGEAYKGGNVINGDITSVKPVNAKATKAEGKLNIKKHAGANPLVFKEAKGNSRVNKVLPDGGYNWETLGEADYTDAITVAPLADYGVPAQTFKVEIQESQSQPGIYRLVNIHDNNPNVGDMGLSLADPEVDSYMIFNTLDGGPVIQEAVYNLLDPLEYEHEYVVSQINTGTFENDVVVIPAGAIAVGLGIEPWEVLEFDDDYNPVIPADYSEKVFTTSEDLVIVLPGATYNPGGDDADYSFTLLQLNMCMDDENCALIGFEGGEDIKSYKFLDVPGRYSGTPGNLDVAASNGQDINAGVYNIGTFDEQGWYTIFVVGFNEAGERVAGDALWFYSYAHDPEEWTSLGNVLFTDDTFGPVYGVDDEIATVKVEMLESKSKPGLYRLVNPYAGHQLIEEYPGLIECHINHNHYLDIDASDAEDVVISDMPIGIDVQGEFITLKSNSSGKLVNNKITFIKNGLYCGAFGGQEEGYYLANQLGRFAVELPCTLKVKAFDNDGNPVEGAYVNALREEAVTDANGEASISLFGVLGTKVAVSVYKDYLFWEGEADFTESAEAWAIAELAAPDCTLKVKAFDKNGDPVAGAMVYANGVDGETNENGEATLTLPGVIGKQVAVSVYKDYLFWEGKADFTESMEAFLLAELTGPDCSLIIKALDKDGNPVADAHVVAAGVEGVTDEFGSASLTLPDVIGTKVTVSVYKDYLFWEGEADFTESMDAFVIAELVAPDCTLKVTVIDGDSEPVEGATVEANGKDAVTDANGNAAIEVGDVIGKTIKVNVSKDGYDAAEAEADFTESMENHIVVVLKAKTVGISLAVIDADKSIKVYDLNGRRVEHPSVGNIYIVNGKKVRLTE